MRFAARFGMLLATCNLLSDSCHSQLIGITWDRGGELYSISATDASVKLIGRTGLTLPESLDFGPDGRLYTTTDGVLGLTSELYSIDPHTAKATLIGPTEVAQFEGALAFAPNGTAYGGGASNSNIYTIDVRTGKATVLGSIGPHDINGMAFRSDGVLIAFEGVASGGLYSIDLATLTTTTIGTLPILRQIGGLAVSGDDAYLIGRMFADQVDSLFKLDLYSGETSLVGKIDLGGPFVFSGWFSGLAAIPIPEPSLLAISLGAFVSCPLRLHRPRGLPPLPPAGD